ncbi:hypothetical protein DFQ26_009394 [Actinomortierella ambigua]|nr:hypothetical protein DFQ26_009394 [Actinomortierella ambigua]
MLQTSSNPSAAIFNRETPSKAYVTDPPSLHGSRPNSSSKTPISTNGISNGSRRAGGTDNASHNGHQVPPRSFKPVPSIEPRTTKAVGQEQPAQQLRELRLPQPAKWRLGQDHLTSTQTNQTNGAASQDLRGSWVSVREYDASSPASELDNPTDHPSGQNGQNAQDKLTAHHKEQRWSVGTHMSVAHCRHLDQTSNMRLLSDETPPDEMDASWGLDALDDDAETEHHHEGKSQPARAEGVQEKTSVYSAQSHFCDPYTATSGTHHHRNINNNDTVHGYGNMDYDEQPDTPTATRHGISAASAKFAMSQPQVRHDDYDPSDNDTHSSGSSFASAHLKRVSTPPPQQQQQASTNTSKFPWRDSKLDNIFMDLLSKETSGQPLRQPSPGPTNRDAQQRAPSPFNPGHSDVSASLSFGEIMDALNNVEDSLEHRTNPTSTASRENGVAQVSRQRKFAKARERLAQLSPPVQDLQRSREATPQPEKSASASRLSTATPCGSGEESECHEALERQRRTVIKAAMAIDPNDDRSVAPSSSVNSHREDILAKRKLALRRLACATDMDPTSFGSPQSSQPSSKETDRTSTTSRDSLYRESISGSTLGPISAGPMENGVAKAEAAAQEMLALKVDALFQDPARNIEARRSSILPLLLNQKSSGALASKTMVDTSDDQQPRVFAQNRRTSFDPAKAKQYEALANRRLEKQASSFVEQLANGTDSAIRSTSLDQTQKPSSAPLASEVEDEHGGSDSEDEELRLSTGMDDAFKCLEDMDLDLSIDAQIELTGQAQRRQSTDIKGDSLLSGVMLPSQPKRKGEYSLRWEAQLGNDDDDDHEPIAVQRRDKRSSLPPDNGSTVNVGDTSTATAGLMPEHASFSHAEGHLVRYITSLHPWDEWDQVKTLDLTRREVESTIHLDHLVPNLETLNLSENQVTYLTGVPKSVRTLLAKSNQLSDLTNFAHLMNLQYLDVSHNGIEDLTGLSNLGHLRELIAVGNRIKSVAALQQMDGLIRLDMSRNCLQRIDFKWSKLQRLEYFNASHNQIEQLDNLESLTGLIHANLGHNSIEDISLVHPLRRLRILNLTQNRLVQFDAKPFPNLKTLYLDDNRLETLQNCASLTRLENFSVRDQEGDGTLIDMTEFLNSRKLYLSGNPVHSLDLSAGFYQLEYLEICAGCLSELPPDFASLMPNLRGLNLSYNELDSLASLEGLHRLRRLVFVGNNLKRFNAVLALVKQLRSLVTLDLRHNPLTSNVYPVMSVRQGDSPYQDTYRTGQMSATESDWRRRDMAFRRSLPDSMYLKRSLYRATIIKACKRLEWFDGALIQDKERERIPYVLGELLDRAGQVMMRRDDDEDLEDEEDEELCYDRDDGNGGHHPQMMVAAPEHGELLPRIKPFVLADRRSIMSGATTRSSNVTSSSQGRRDSRQSPDLRHQTRWMAHAPGITRTPGGNGAINGGGRGVESPCPRGDSTTLRPRQTGTAATFQHGLVNDSNHHGMQHKRATLNVESGRLDAQAVHHSRKQRHEEREDDHQATPSVKSDGSDRRSAVRNWRDEVNEVSRRHRMVTSTPRSASSASRASPTHQAPPTQQQKQSQSQPSSGIPSARSSRLPPPRTSTGPPPTTLTLAIHQKLAQASSSSPRASYQHHGRRRSDGILHHQHHHQLLASGGRGGIAGAGAGGSPRTDAARISPLTPRSMSQSVHLTRPAHSRRRSLGQYHSIGGGHGHRRRETMLGDHHHHLGQSPTMVTSPQDYFMSMSVPAGGFEAPAGGAVGSPSYFTLNPHHHQSSGHGHQTPFGGMSRSMHGTLGGGGRSIPNTPSRANGRLSQQGYPFHTLARDMERNDT